MDIPRSGHERPETRDQPPLWAAVVSSSEERKLTLPAPESPTSTIFSRFSADSSSMSDIGDAARVRRNESAAVILSDDHASGMTRPPGRSSADYNGATWNVAARVLWSTSEVRIDRQWWPVRRRRRRRRRLLAGMNKLANNR